MLQVITDPLTGRTKGFGFVRFGEEKDRDDAITEMGGTVVNDRPIRVSLATARKAPNPQLPTAHADSELLILKLAMSFRYSWSCLMSLKHNIMKSVSPCWPCFLYLSCYP